MKYMTIKRCELYDVMDEFDMYSLVYYVHLYSGNRKLRFIIDTGAERGFILQESLEGCQFTDTGVGTNIVGIAGKTDGKVINLQFDPDEQKAVQNDCTFGLDFIVANTESAVVIQNRLADGILGCNFLQNCCINLRQCYLDIVCESV